MIFVDIRIHYAVLNAKEVLEIYIYMLIEKTQLLQY